MTTNQQTENLNPYQQKKQIYTALSIIFCLLPIVGYFADSGFTLPSLSDILWLPLNFGTYGIGGIFVVFALVLIIASLYVLVSCIRRLGLSFLGIVLSIGATILFYGLAVTVLVEGISLLYSLLSNFLGALMSWEIPGVSETLGGAIFSSLLYDIPFIMFIIKAKKYRTLSCGSNSTDQESHPTIE